MAQQFYFFGSGYKHKLLNKRTRTIPVAKEETDEASAIEEKKNKDALIDSIISYITDFSLRTAHRLTLV